MNPSWVKNITEPSVTCLSATHPASKRALAMHCRQPESVAQSKLPEPKLCPFAGAASRWGGARGRLEVRIIEARNLTFGSGVLNKFHTLVRWRPTLFAGTSQDSILSILPCVDARVTFSVCYSSHPVASGGVGSAASCECERVPCLEGTDSVHLLLLQNTFTVASSNDDAGAAPHTTRPISRSLTPHWDELAVFKDVAPTDRLHVSVLDRRLVGPHLMLGEVRRVQA